MKENNKLMVKDYQIVSNPLVNVRTEFEFLNKALKFTSVFAGNNLSHVIVANNAVYLCWGDLEEDFLKKHGFMGFSLRENYNSFKKSAEFISKLVKTELSQEDEDLSSDDKYDKYAENCYLGCRITTEFNAEEDEHFSYSSYYKAYAKVVPSWITLEK